MTISAEIKSLDRIGSARAERADVQVDGGTTYVCCFNARPECAPRRACKLPIPYCLAA